MGLGSKVDVEVSKIERALMDVSEEGSSVNVFTPFREGSGRKDFVGSGWSLSGWAASRCSGRVTPHGN